MMQQSLHVPLLRPDTTKINKTKPNLEKKKKKEDYAQNYSSSPLIGEEKRFLRNGILSGLTLKVFSVAFECFYMRGIENNL